MSYCQLKYKIGIYLWFCLATILSAHGQTDSLEKILGIQSGAEKIETLLKLGKILQTNNSSKSAQYVFSALKISQEIKCTDCESRSLFQLGELFIVEKNYSNALVYLKKALLISEIDKNNDLVAEINSRIAILYELIGNYDKAERFGNNSIENYKLLLLKSPTNEQLMLKLCRKFLWTSSIFCKLNEYSKAEKLAHSAKELAEKLPKSTIQAEVFLAFANLHSSKNEFSKSIQAYKNAIQASDAIGNKPFIASIYRELGKIYYKNNDYALSQQAFQEALKTDTILKNINGAACDYIHLGKIHTNNRNFESAGNLLNKALQLSITINDLMMIRDSYQSIYTLYNIKNEHQKALDYLNLFYQYKDSVANESDRLKLSEFQAIYKAQAQEKEIEILSNNNLLKENEIKNQKRLIYSFIAIFIIILVFSFVLLKQAKQKRKSMALLAEQNEEIILAQNELRVANLLLVKNEERLSLVVQNMPVMMTALGDKNQVIFWNKECEVVTGYSEKEVFETPEIFEKYFPEVNHLENYKTSDYSIDIRNQEIEIECKNGEKKYISWSNISGSVPVVGWKIWLIGYDITERVHFERSLMHEKAITDSLMNSIPDLIFYKDMQGRYLGVNSAVCNFFGKKTEDFIGRTDIEIFPQEIAEIFHSNDLLILQNQVPVRRLRWKTTSNNKNVVLDTLKISFKSESGEILGLVGVCRDITDKIKYEEGLKFQKEQAVEADKQKSAFLANMSHEIRTPMNAIIGFSDLLSKSNVNVSQRNEYLNYISSCGKDLLHLIDDIIDIAKIEADQIKIVKTNCPVNKIITEIQVTFEQEIKRKGKTLIELKNNKTIADPALTIFSDPFRFRQILMNLLNNALKFTDNGFIEYGYTVINRKTINAQDNNQLKRYLQFYVKDSGIGMPADKLKLIFERFGQVEDSYSRNLTGTGLGLAISKKLVELLGGEIWVESVQNEGSTFYFTLPFDTIEMAKNTNSSQQVDKKNIDWSTKTVLIAEDDLMNFRLLEQSLLKTKINVIWAQDGEEAVEKSKNNKEISIILMDIQMPKKNGYAATQEIRQMGLTIPVIVQTAFAMSGEKEKSKNYGCTDFITKPILPKDLIEIMSKYLD